MSPSPSTCKQMLAAHWRALSLLSALSLGACESVPDLKVVALNIPASASYLLVGVMMDDGLASKSFQVIPLAGMGDDARARFSVGLQVGNVDSNSGSISLATVNSARCITSVASSAKLTRSGGVTASITEVQLDPSQNGGVIPLAPSHSASATCPKVPGLGPDPLDGPISLPIRPVLINTSRLLSSRDGVVDGAFVAYGWGLDRGTLTVSIDQDPMDCRSKLRAEILAPDPNNLYRQYLAALITSPVPTAYPDYSLLDYTTAEIRMSKFNGPLQQVGESLANRLLLCFAMTTQTYRKQNPDGAESVFVEASPK